MKNHVIDNSLKDLGKTVLWQYDRAVRLLSVIKHMQMLYHCAVEQFWEYWRTRILSIDTCSAMGCALWGMLLGVPRPTVKGADGKERLIATEVYRRVLKGAYYFMKSKSSFPELQGYIEILFGIGGKNSLSKWTVEVSEYGWYTNVDELNDVYQPNVAYTKGHVFCIDEAGTGHYQNWKCIADISRLANVSFSSIKDFIEETDDPTTRSQERNTILLKLFDPQGICRKIGSAPYNSLSVEVEFVFGETTIYAQATRREKCGISLIDNNDMSCTYEPSPYFDEMHEDQKLLFEQKKDTYCFTPLGIKNNDPTEWSVFGFPGDSLPEGAVPAVPGPNTSSVSLVYLPYWYSDVIVNPTSIIPFGSQETAAYVWANGMTYSLWRYDAPTIPNWNDIAMRENLSYFGTHLGYISTSGSNPYFYHPSVAYAKGVIFSHDDADGIFNYICLSDISAAENTSFESIRTKVKKTNKGAPSTSTFSMNDPPYIDLRKLHKPYMHTKRNIPRINGYEYDKITSLLSSKDLQKRIQESHPIYILGPSEIVLVKIDNLLRLVFLPMYVFILQGSHEYDTLYSELDGDKTLSGDIFSRAVVIWVKKGDSMESIMEEIGFVASQRAWKIIDLEKAGTLESGQWVRTGMVISINNEKRVAIKDFNYVREEDGYLYTIPFHHTSILRDQFSYLPKGALINGS